MSVIDLLAAQPVAQAVGWALLQFVWQGAVLGAITALLLAALRRSAPDIRYVVASIALTVMATLPIVTALQGANTAVRLDAPRDAVAGLGPSEIEPAASAVPAPATGIDARRGSPEAGRADTAEPARALDGQSAPGLALFAAAWMCGVAILSLRLASCWLWVQGLKRRRAVPVPQGWQEAARILARQLHIRRPVRLLESASVAVPTVIGWLRPVVLMPVSALAGLAPEQVQAILAHELAHIRRHDYLVNLLQTLVETLLFYHPAVWWLSRRIRAEREHCCDDLAVSLCGDPYTYARALADLEGLRTPSVPLALAATGGSLLERVRRLVRPSHAGRAPGWAAGIAAVLLITGVGLGAIGNEWRQSDRSAPLAAGRPTPDAHALRAMSSEVRSEARATARAARSAARAMAFDLRQSVRSAVVPLRQATRSVALAIRAAFGPHVGADRSSPGAWPAPPARPSPPARPLLPARPAAPASPARPATPASPSRPAMPASPSRPATPSVPDPGDPGAAAGAAQAASSGQRQHGTVSWSRNGQKLDAIFEGEFEFTDDDLDVQRMSPNGTLRITDGGWFSRHTVEFRADASGAIERRYRDGTSERPFEPEGRQWLAQVLPAFIRQTGIGAAARVARILKQGGPQAVLREIALIEGSYGKRLYFSELMKAPTLDGPTRIAVLTQAGREIDSDFELATFLIEHRDRLVSDDGARRAYLDAARGIQSDFELRRVLSAAVDNTLLPPVLLSGLLDASTSIESDLEEATLLVQVAKQSVLDPASRGSFFRALGTVDSDFEHHRVLTALADRPDLPDDVLRQMLTSSSAIGSDFEQSSFLVQVVDRRSIAALRDPFFQALSNVDSAFERGRVLQAVLEQPDVPQEVLLSVLLATEQMGGSFEASQVLQAAASQHQLTGRARDLYVNAASRLKTFEQGQALAALARSDRR